MYQKFLKDGIKYVFVLGNLVEGPYVGKDLMEFGKSLNFNDAKMQADHLIEYFPKVEGIKTLFITGETDHTWKDFNVGKSSSFSFQIVISNAKFVFKYSKLYKSCKVALVFVSPFLI